MPSDDSPDAADENLLEGTRASDEPPLPAVGDELETPTYISDGANASWLGKDVEAGSPAARFREELSEDDASDNDEVDLRDAVTLRDKKEQEDESDDEDAEFLRARDFLESTDERRSRGSDISHEKTISEQPSRTAYAPPPQDSARSSSKGTERLERERSAREGELKIETTSKWILGKRLGSGGQGEVYEGKNALSGLEVAVKKVLVAQVGTKGSDTGHALRQLQQEAESLAQFSHPNIVRLVDFAQIRNSPTPEQQRQFFADVMDDRELGDLFTNKKDDGLNEVMDRFGRFQNAGALEFVMVMERMNGTLKDEMYGKDEKGAKVSVVLDANRAVDIIKAVGEGLQAVHDKGVLHRDIKPENIMFDEYGVPKLGDFGLALSLEKRTQGLAGSPQYMAPEQLRGGVKLNPQTDVYGLGATLYHVLTGKSRLEDELAPAYQIKSSLKDAKARREDEEQKRVTAIASTILKGHDFSSPIRLRPELGPRGEDLSAVVMKALSFYPELRYESVGEFCADLARWQNDELVHARVNASRDAMAFRDRLIEERGLAIKAKSEAKTVDEAEAFKAQIDVLQGMIDHLGSEVIPSARGIEYSKDELSAYRWAHGGRRKARAWGAGAVAGLAFAGLAWFAVSAKYEQLEEQRVREGRLSELVALRGDIDAKIGLASVAQVGSLNELSESVERAYSVAVANKEFFAEAREAVEVLEGQRAQVRGLIAERVESDRVGRIMAGAAAVQGESVVDGLQRLIAAYRSVKDSESSHARSAQVELLARIDAGVVSVQGDARAAYEGVAAVETDSIAQARDRIARARSVVTSGQEVRGREQYEGVARVLGVWDEALAAAHAGRVEESLSDRSAGAKTPALRDVLLTADEAGVRRFEESAAQEMVSLEECVRHGAAALSQYQIAVRLDGANRVFARRLEEMSGKQGERQARLGMVRQAAQVSAGVLGYRRAMASGDYLDAIRRLSEVYGQWQEPGVVDLIEGAATGLSNSTSRRAFVGFQSVLDYAKEVRACYDDFFFGRLVNEEAELRAKLGEARSRLELRLRPAREPRTQRLPDESYAELMRKAETERADAEVLSQRRLGGRTYREDEADWRRRSAEAEALDRRFLNGELDYRAYSSERERLRQPARQSGQK